MPFSYYTRLVTVLAVTVFFFSQTGRSLSQELSSESDMAASGKIVIDMESYAFTPSEISVADGTPLKLILRNQSFLVPHNFLLDDPNGDRVLEIDISSGESQAHTLTLPEPGIYSFYCDKQLLFFPSHRGEGMEGRLIVK